MRAVVLEQEGEIYYGFSLVATFQPYKDGVRVEPTKAATIGKYLAAIVALRDKGYDYVYENSFK